MKLMICILTTRAFFHGALFFRTKQKNVLQQGESRSDRLTENLEYIKNSNIQIESGIKDPCFQLLKQRCQTYGLQAKTGPTEALIRPVE